MTETTTTTDVKDRVTAVLAGHFPDGQYIATSHTKGTAAIVIDAAKDRPRLAQYAAALREAGLIVADHSNRGQLYIREHGPAHDLAMAQVIAGVCANGYDEHVRAHEPEGTSFAEGIAAAFACADGGMFIVEREGREYDVRVTPRLWPRHGHRKQAEQSATEGQS